MSDQSALQSVPAGGNPPTNPNPGDTADIPMTDASDHPSQQQLQPQPQTASNAPSPAPQSHSLTTSQQGRIPTPSRASSLHPPDAPTPPTTGVNQTGDKGFTMPAEAAPHGAPVRQYINSKITGVLLEGMKLVAREQPKDPLRVLGEFLIQKSKELEGKDAPSASS